MIISGFTFIKNATLYDFQVVESITSMLPLVDEMIVVAGDSGDNTNELLSTINSPKIKIINTKWDPSKFKGGAMIYAEQTDIALSACTGDWCVYIQSDEVLHEDAIPVIRAACEKYLPESSVEGMTLDYVHIYADYKHYIDSMHFGYPREIRIVRGQMPDIHSWRDAQSFRIMPDFDGVSYQRETDTRKLNCIALNGALMFHYGWSRDPRAMAPKQKLSSQLYSPSADTEQKAGVDYYDYGNLSKFPLYKKSQPALIKARAEAMSWSHLLRYEGARVNIKKISGLKYRIITFIENKILCGTRLGGFKNYELVGKFRLPQKGKNNN